MDTAVQPMRLSEAMRLGAMLRPQAFGAVFKVHEGPDGPVIASCATGAVNEGAGLRTVKLSESSGEVLIHLGPASAGGQPVVEQWSELLERVVVCPELGCDGKDQYSVMHSIPLHFDVSRAIIHLNDFHRWTRERIADWVESIERQHDASTERTPEFAGLADPAMLAEVR